MVVGISQLLAACWDRQIGLSLTKKINTRCQAEFEHKPLNLTREKAANEAMQSYVPRCHSIIDTHHQTLAAPSPQDFSQFQVPSDLLSTTSRPLIADCGDACPSLDYMASESLSIHSEACRHP